MGPSGSSSTSGFMAAVSGEHSCGHVTSARTARFAVIVMGRGLTKMGVAERPYCKHPPLVRVHVAGYKRMLMCAQMLLTCANCSRYGSISPPPSL